MASPADLQSPFHPSSLPPFLYLHLSMNGMNVYLVSVLLILFEHCIIISFLQLLPELHFHLLVPSETVSSESLDLPDS